LFAPANNVVVAQLEQVSEQVAAPVLFAITTTAEVEQGRRVRASEGIQLQSTVVPMISSIQLRAYRGES
jgi:6,7-dimethyl-8-ribityllumazine synthase